MRLILSKNIKDNMSLAEPIYYNGNILLNVGVKNLNKYKEKLMEKGITHLYVEDKYSLNISINSAVREKTRRNGKKIIAETFKKVQIGSTNIKVDKLNKIVEDIISDIINEKDILNNLVSLKNINDYTFEHSINVGVLCVVFGKILKYNFNDLRKLGMGGILHDIGKMLIPEEILNKKSKLTNYEYKLMKKHPELGFKYLEKFDAVSPLSRVVVYSHHEKVDGSGYPCGIKGDNIHKFAKIAAIADVFDALTSERIYRKRWPIFKAVDYIISNTDSFFDYKLARRLLPTIAAYPNGAEVILSTGERGVVKKQNKNFSTRPIIRVFKDSAGKEVNFEINLLNNTNITVEKVIV